MKPHKIKRYSKKRGFSPKPPRSPWKIVLYVALVVGLVFLGISVYQPVMDFISGKTTPTPPAEPDPESIASTPDPTPEPKPEPIPEPEPTPEVIKLGEEVTAKHLPYAVAVDATALEQYLEELGPNFNALVLDVKDSQGKVYYATENQEAKDWQAVVEQPVEISAVVEQLQKRELHLIVRMSVFSDPVAARGNIDQNAVMHSSGVLWLDNTLAAGGKPWASPYSPLVQEYNKNLAQELTALGVEMILLDHVRFPYDPTNTARFSEDGTQTRSEVLQGFVNAVTQAVEVSVGVVTPYGALLAEEGLNQAFYGGSPLELVSDALVLDMSGQTFTDGEGAILPQAQETMEKGRQAAEHLIILLHQDQIPAAGVEESFLLYE